MNETHDVISAFLDDEPFDADRLIAALSDPAGRELLIDLVALRHLAQTDHEPAPAMLDRRPARSTVRTLLAAAAVLVALVGGYVAGERRNEPSTTTAPPATRVVQTTTPWQDVIPGRMR
jgi:hypothetical protein